MDLNFLARSTVCERKRESLKRPTFVQDSSYVIGVTIAQKRCDPRYAQHQLSPGPLRYFFRFWIPLSATKADILLHNNLFYELGIGCFGKFTEKYFRNDLFDFNNFQINFFSQAPSVDFKVKYIDWQIIALFMYTYEKLAREIARNSFILNKKYFYNQSTSSLEIFAKKNCHEICRKTYTRIIFRQIQNILRIMLIDINRA